MRPFPEITKYEWRMREEGTGLPEAKVLKERSKAGAKGRLDGMSVVWHWLRLQVTGRAKASPGPNDSS